MTTPDISTIEQAALTQIAQASDLTALDAIRVAYLGKKGELSALLKQVSTVAEQDRKSFGQAVNLAKQSVQTAIIDRKQVLSEALLDQKLVKETIDVTLPGRKNHTGGAHPVARALARVTQIFKELGFDVATGPEIEDDFHNFEALNTPEHHPAPAMHDTFY